MTDQTPTRTLTIAEAAAATGLSPHTLRYYERDGLLLDAVERASSGHRRYTERDLGWLHLLTRLRATGMPIREIREYADLVRRGDGTEPQRLALLQAHRDAVRAQLAEAAEHLAAIEMKIDLYAGRLGTGEAVPEAVGR
ncbi:MerR family transcriptional regulator [Cellulomonas hominis]|uniref:DNA-binding transcriptional MerR regulator n=1 Tax=Cellulomonas hominis TaxID=156981 RepID=A0A511FFC8_9CELL|nr:MerR family transcriptional regulator [Cellulomonas hominis]MBB5472730.1 DNA-binding transcriptional MerR regulator [Cellulomonas hominis]NKY07718.1 MerR family transcriptional regulator [Cellulomonas hominis]GEL47950.1 MerR family transcriptional regulator [Cellulomonas hominis]